MKRRRRIETGSLDSLLDTMTNVVGILVIVMIVTQLGVGDAIRRILRTADALPEVSPASLARARLAAENLQGVQEELAARWKERERQLPADQTSLDQLKKLQDELRADLKKISNEATDRNEIQKRDDQHNQRVAQLQKKITDARVRLAELKAALEGTPMPEVLPARVVRLPNPRSAPKDARPIFFFCRHGRIAELRQEGLRKLAHVRARRLLEGRPMDGLIDCEKLTGLFERADIGNRNFRLKVRIYNFDPYLAFDLRPDGGETAEQISSTRAQFQKAIRRANKAGNFYARFLVWPDSYETYLVARQVADEIGMAAGWVPYQASQEWHERFINKKCVGWEPPPPAPPAPPAPARPAPPPSRKPLPNDDID